MEYREIEAVSLASRLVLYSLNVSQRDSWVSKAEKKILLSDISVQNSKLNMNLYSNNL